MKWLADLVFLALLGTLGHSAHALEIMHVQHEPAAFDPAKKEKATLRFRISEPAKVEVHLFDVRDLRVRTLKTAPLAPGDHEIAWDGLSQRGRPVPPEAYHYTLVATGQDGARVEWDVTDFTSGEDVRAQEVKWDAKAGTLSYFLPEAARVNVRLGLANNGPLLRTLLDWVPRTAGSHSEAWDGKDASSELDLSDHPGLLPSVSAFRLADNTLFVLPFPRTTQMVEPVPQPELKRAKKKEVPRRMFAYGQQPYYERRDFALALDLVGDLTRDSDGLPVVDPSVPVGLRVALPADEAARAANERFEIVFFVDGQWVFENEIGFLPTTWRWDPRGTNEGIHYITANLRGYDGHYGTATLRVKVVGSQSSR